MIDFSILQLLTDILYTFGSSDEDSPACGILFLEHLSFVIFHLVPDLSNI